jgi:hypothetical protein
MISARVTYDGGHFSRRYRYEGLREADFLRVMQSLKQAMAAQFGPCASRLDLRDDISEMISSRSSRRWPPSSARAPRDRVSRMISARWT